MVMPRSRSKSLLSNTLSVFVVFLERLDVCCSNLSTRVVLPWSTWAMMAMLRRFIALLLARTMLERDLAGKPGPTFPDHTQKPGVREGARRPKRKPGQKDRANPTRCGAI